MATTVRDMSCGMDPRSVMDEILCVLSCITCPRFSAGPDHAQQRHRELRRDKGKTHFMFLRQALREFVVRVKILTGTRCPQHE